MRVFTLAERRSRRRQPGRQFASMVASGACRMGRTRIRKSSWEGRSSWNCRRWTKRSIGRRVARRRRPERLKSVRSHPSFTNLLRVGMSNDPRGVVEVVARESYGRLVAFLAARTRDVAAAEDALADAFVAA